jgi:hypothetical protein
MRNNRFAAYSVFWNGINNAIFENRKCCCPVAMPDEEAGYILATRIEKVHAVTTAKNGCSSLSGRSSQ